MSHDVNWDVEKYRNDHESEEQWLLRRDFMERWKHEYPEERLICLGHLFVNIEVLGCRYPLEVMREVARLSEEVAKNYRELKKTKLQRTFVSASDAAEDRAKGVKRKGGIISNEPPEKSSKIAFVAQGCTVDDANTSNGDSKMESLVTSSDSEDDLPEKSVASAGGNTETSFNSKNNKEYLMEMQNLKCLDVREFNERMFFTPFGKMVLVMRPWTNKFDNIQASCAACQLNHSSVYDKHCFTFTINGTLIAQATGQNKAEARSVVEALAWNRLREECVSVVVKEQWIAQGDARITTGDVTGVTSQNGVEVDGEFGTPIESSVATKMMKLMGWTGGGLGADSQGIAEPIKPHLQMVRRAGLGSVGDAAAGARALMQRYARSACPDLDLVFAADFSKEERGRLHQLARRHGLQSRSYGRDRDRFLVVKKKFNPFNLVIAIIEKGGVTPKYQVFLPATLAYR